MKRFFTTSRYREHNRKDLRHEVPKLHLVLGNREFSTYDWSLGENMDTTNSIAVVTRILVGKNQVAFSFKKLDEEAYDFLEKASMQRLAHLGDT